MNIKCGETLQVDDFLQNYSVDVKVKHHVPADDEPKFTLVSEGVNPKPKAVETEKNGSTTEEKDSGNLDDDDLEIIETDLMITEHRSLKRKLTEGDAGPVPSKRLNYIEDDDDDDDDQCVTIN